MKKADMKILKSYIAPTPCDMFCYWMLQKSPWPCRNTL